MKYVTTFLSVGLTSLFLTSISMAEAAPADGNRKPNIIFIMADDLGYGELGCYGQQKIQTPNLDGLAKQSLKFTQYYAGATVCAPSRSVLMTGLHTGHTRVRGNSTPEKQTLKDEDVTLAELLKSSGYSTGLAGKWGLGDTLPGGEPGLATRQGFDFFFGYYNQHHAHNYFPSFLFRNEDRVNIPNKGQFDERGAGKVTDRKVYAHDLILDESLQFIRQHQAEPFFLYCAWTLPHANNEHKEAGIADHGIYKDRDWTDANKMHAAMVSYLDTQVGHLLKTLDDLKLSDNTLIFFTSDNGPHTESGNTPKFFNSSGVVRGTKRSLYDGGIRVPLLVRWPGKIKPGTSDHIAYHGDILATLSEIVGFKAPSSLDSMSFAPTLLGQPGQKVAPYLYWEFYEGAGARATRIGNWKGVRPKWHAPIEIYDISTDLQEEHNLASERPELVKQVEHIMETAHTDDPTWPAPKK